MTCSTVQDLVYDYLDGELSPAQRVAFQSRLAQCGDCRTLVLAVAGLLSRVRATMRTVAAPHWLGARISAALAMQVGDPRGKGGRPGTDWH